MNEKPLFALFCAGAVFLFFGTDSRLNAFGVFIKSLTLVNLAV